VFPFSRHFAFIVCVCSCIPSKVEPSVDKRDGLTYRGGFHHICGLNVNISRKSCDLKGLDGCAQ